MSATPRRLDLPQPEAVVAFLRAHPGWLAENPELYRTLAPPVRVHGEPLADHMAAMLEVARAQTNTLLAVGRAARSLAGRVEEAVLALVRAADPVASLSAELPALLGVDAVTLCIEAEIAGARALPAGMIGRLLGEEEVRIRFTEPRLANPTESVFLHGEAAALACHEALVRLPGTAVPALLALACRDPFATPARAARAPLLLLARAAAAALERA
ncbi:MAG: hypothetical protein M0002_08890 [Rhodospirillales bacterium]|nr:hypothetical protein [Rhodospirillales bacterium]